MSFCILSIFITFLYAVRIYGINLSLDVPTTSYVGESIELICSYNLGDDLLYSVKWYKDEVEFFRYLPKSWPPGQFLPMAGIRLDLQKSGRHSIYLKQVDIHTAGVYKCEVSTEAPYFVTAEAQRTLEVTVLPLGGPEITGSQSKYKVGSHVNLTCISAKSKPAAILKWFINDQEVKSEYETVHSAILHPDGLETSILGLQFIVKESHFKNDNLKIKCTSTIKQIHVMSNEALALKHTENKQQSSGLFVSESQIRNTSSSIGLSRWNIYCCLILLFAKLITNFDSSQDNKSFITSSSYVVSWFNDKG